MLNKWQPETLYKLGHTVQFEGEKYQVLKKHVSSVSINSCLPLRRMLCLFKGRFNRVGQSDKTPLNCPELYGIPDKFALSGAAWYESNGLMGSDWDIKRRGLGPGGYPQHQSDTPTLIPEPESGVNANASPSSVFSWAAAKKTVVSNIKHLLPGIREGETAARLGRDDGSARPLLVGAPGNVVPASSPGSVREPAESLYGGEGSSILLNVSQRGH
ncbi:hypothetical protein B0F90DRAFT_1821994 [Multifurca ochricompacta]|uniref:Uncharacterized protein n=1 Tax=Multifurca ochricompacta TaxID=376703 RepID=A0AAD4LX38_9AGAM|nr:hypothetical protein B0F90DRAFT_1821994 [Multifurca ochricompacta]